MIQPVNKGEHQVSPPLQLVLNLNIPPGLSELAMQLLSRFTLTESPPMEASTFSGFGQRFQTPPEADERTRPQRETSPAVEPRIQPTSQDASRLDPAWPYQSKTLVELYSEMCGESDRLKNLAPRTIEHYLEAIRHFERWLTETLKKDPRIGYPGVTDLISPAFFALRQIEQNPRLLQQFAADQVSSGSSARTAVKKSSAVRKLLLVCHAAGSLSVLPETPDEKSLNRAVGCEADSELPETVTLEEYRAIREACKAATWPRIAGRSPGDYWLFAVDSCWTYGFRLLDWFSYKKEKTGITWEHVTMNPVCPAPQLKGLEHPSGWIWVPIAKARTRKLLLPQSVLIREHFDRWIGVDPIRVVPLPHGKTHNRHWRLILKRAGVDPRIRLSEGRGIPSFRKGCAVNWESIDGELADYVLGHRSKSMRGRHYGQQVRRVAQHIESLLR